MGALSERLPFKGDRHPSIQVSAAWAKPHEPPAARIYCRFPPTKIYLWQVFLSFSPGIGLCLLGRDVKHHYNVLVSDRGRGPSLNLPLIFGVTGLCLSETGLHDGGPGWSTAPSSCDHQYSLIFTLSLCSSRSPFAQRFSNIHCHQENKYFHPRACGDEEVAFLCRFKKLWMALAVSPSPSLEISH